MAIFRYTFRRCRWLLVFASLCGCQDDKASDDAISPSIPIVQVVAVERAERPLMTSVSFGRLKAQREGYLAFRRGGQLATIGYDIGDRVADGEPLAELELTDLKDSRNELQQSIDDTTQRLQQATQDSVEALRAELETLQTRQRDLETELARGVIVAPYSCIVTHREADVGTLVSPTTPIFRVVEDGLPHIEARLPRDLLARLAEEPTYQVKMDGQLYLCRLKARAPSLDAAGNERAILEFADPLPETNWQYGRVVEVRFDYETSDSGFWIPVTALGRRTGGQWTVMVAEEQGETYRVASRFVDVIRTRGEFALVDAVFVEEELVVADGRHRVVAGQTVEVDVSAPVTNEPRNAE